MKAAKKRKKKKMYGSRACGGRRKGGCAFEWKVIDLVLDITCKRAA